MSPGTPAAAGKRIASIDALRGLVMLPMLVDHVRETVFLHVQVGNPDGCHRRDAGALVRALQAAPAGPCLAPLLLRGSGRVRRMDLHRCTRLPSR